MVYAPVKEWNGEEPPQHVYSEMHMADWWWETQVGSDGTFHGTFYHTFRYNIGSQ